MRFYWSKNELWLISIASTEKRFRGHRHSFISPFRCFHHSDTFQLTNSNKNDVPHQNSAKSDFASQSSPTLASHRIEIQEISFLFSHSMSTIVNGFDGDDRLLRLFLPISLDKSLIPIRYTCNVQRARRQEYLFFRCNFFYFVIRLFRHTWSSPQIVWLGLCFFFALGFDSVGCHPSKKREYYLNINDMAGSVRQNKISLAESAGFALKCVVCVCVCDLFYRSNAFLTSRNVFYFFCAFVRTNPKRLCFYCVSIWLFIQNMLHSHLVAFRIRQTIRSSSL